METHRPGKLVRDLIPEVIRRTGQTPITCEVSGDDYRVRLRLKLFEEVEEFLDADIEQAPEGLADVLEVVYALAADLGVTPEGLDKIRTAKACERGAFTREIVWLRNEA